VNAGGEIAKQQAKGLLKSWVTKMMLGFIFSYGGVIVLAIIIGVITLMGVMSFIATDEPKCNTNPSGSGDPTYVSSEPSDTALADIPKNYLPVYEKAAAEYNIDWATLASVGAQETGHGEGGKEVTCIGSSAGAQGPMQFMPGTWAEVGYDANNDGQADPCHYVDSIYSAAKYLSLSGAPGDYQAALFQYNNAQWYVDEVLARAEEYRAASKDGGSDGGSDGGEDPGSSPAMIPSITGLLGEAQMGLPSLMRPAYAQEPRESPGGETGIVAPVDSEHMDNYENDWGDARPGFTGGFHDGTDILAPQGAPLYSMVSGTVQQESNSNENMYQEVGGYNIVIEASESVGPVEKGDWIQYGHMDSTPNFRPGDTVSAGDVVGEIGDTGYGPEVTRGEFDFHVHVGWYDMTGGERAEHSTGAMNPYPLLEWIKDNGGEVSGDKADNVAPSARPTSSDSSDSPQSPGGGSKCESPSSSATPVSGPGSDKSYPGGTPPDGGTGQQGQTPLGFDLVENETKTMTYFSKTQFASYVDYAVGEWNALGGVKITKAASEAKANVVIFDGNSLGWAWGYTDGDGYNNKGTIEINESKVTEVASETNRKSLMVHELGHAVGMAHANDRVSVMNQNLQTVSPNDYDIQIYNDTWLGP
jgi:murein DD-endopeptidase MepM/ murein hydrolase activator NlpD